MNAILITGGTGFLGRHLAQRLAQQEYDVTITGRNKQIGHQLVKKNICFIPSDLTDVVKIQQLCQNKTAVFHCAALSSPWGKYQNFYQSNVLGTQNVITACQQQGVSRLIYVSTPSIYFDFKDKFLIQENEPLPQKPINHYVKTKRLAEQLIDKAFIDGLSVITIRPRAIFGEFDTTIMPRLIRLAKNGKIPLIDDGKAWIDLTYVGNVVTALQLCQQAPTMALGKKYNITNGEPVQVQEILKQVLEAIELNYNFRSISYRLAYLYAGWLEMTALRQEPRLTRYSVGVLAKSQTLDISAAQQDLGYIPLISMQEAIARYAYWWKKNNC